MIAVKATREGLIGGKTSTGYLVDVLVPFVALPAAAALRQWVTVRNPRNGRQIRALVLDVGPWNINDNAYVFDGARPAAERGLNVSHNGKTNGAGIDLGEKVWHALGMTENDLVEWEFA
jgi:hypothetical protein